jgi:hypothetical protein
LVHHEFEVVVAVDAHGHVVVILGPLFSRDLTVSGVFGLIGVVELEGIQEFVKDFVFGLLAGDDVWVLLGVVSLANIVDVDGARVVLVHNLESFNSKAPSELIHLTSHTTKELLVVDRTVLRAVKDAEETLTV